MIGMIGEYMEQKQNKNKKHIDGESVFNWKLMNLIKKLLIKYWLLTNVALNLTCSQ